MEPTYELKVCGACGYNKFKREFDDEDFRPDGKKLICRECISRGAKSKVTKETKRRSELRVMGFKPDISWMNG